MRTEDSYSVDPDTIAPLGSRSALVRRMESSHARVATLISAPLLFALASVLIGQDANWDLLNYHLHNPWAWLEGRVGRDLAPAHLQSYFNPLLDVPYYLLTRHAPPPVVSAVMGAMQGLSFIALAAIARHYVVGSRTPGATALLLAAAGCASAVLLAELGTTMGDATTAPLALAAIAVVLGAWPVAGTTSGLLAWRRMLVAGVLLGAAAGLKLTNAPYALAACLALAVGWPGNWRDRACVAAVFAAGVAAGLAATAAHWFVTLWHTFGNPLFPQFNGIFRSPLAGTVNVADTRWLPHSLGEALAFPFVLTADPGRAGERPMLQIVLPITYLLGIVVLVRTAWARVRSAAPARGDGRTAFLLVWCALSFILWLALFSIHRYLAVLEMVAPIAIWVLVHRLVRSHAERLVRWLLLLSATVSVVSCNHWGSAGFADTAARVPTPPIAVAPDSVVIVAGAPISWMLPYFPPGPSYLSLGGSFPESPGYVTEAKRRLRAAAGGVSVIFEELDSGSIESLRRIDRRLERWDVAAAGAACGALRWAASKRPKFRAEVSGPGEAGRCRVIPTRESLDGYARRREDAVTERLALLRDRYGLRIDRASCTSQRPSWGDREHPYQVCALSGMAD